MTQKTNNPVLKKLGYSDNDRVVIFHADDIGMCQATVAAYGDLLRHSLLSSTAVMVPCPWFPSAAQFILENQDNPQLDVGVHLTLTCEWEMMRWGPISTTAVSSGLLDSEGYFHRQSEPVQQQAEVNAVAQEIEAQIARAIAFGIEPTHIDSHMGTLFAPRLLPAYVQAAMKFNLPFLGLRLDAEAYIARGYEKETAVQLATFSNQLEAQGFPLFDSIQMLPLREHVDLISRLRYARQLVADLPAGLHYFIIHPAQNTPELQALCEDWQARVGDYALFLSDQWVTAVESADLKVIGFKQLQTIYLAEQSP